MKYRGILTAILIHICAATLQASRSYSLSADSLAETLSADTLPALTYDAAGIPDVGGYPDAPDTAGGTRSDWWLDRIKDHTYSIADTTIRYPRFLKFCVNTYNWADRTFNTYDHDYVLPTGKKWKALMRMSNWTDSYSMTLDRMHIRMLSEVYSGIGPSVSFMAVGLSYQANLNRLVSHRAARQKRYDFSFSCALFWVNVYYSRNRDGTEIRQIGHYHDEHGRRWIKYHFPDLQLESYGLDAYYFFNHGRYYHGAAYNYSKIQKRSQGSFMLGISLAHQDIDMDFSSLPQAMQAQIPGTQRHFRFNYNDFCVLVGYGYNWVFHPKWVWNITGMGALGYKHSLADSVEGRCERASLNVKSRTALAYNLGNFFAGVFGSADVNWYKSHDYSFANAIIAFGAVTGIRF